MHDCSILDGECLLGIFETHIYSRGIIELQNNKLVQKFLSFFRICFRCEIDQLYLFFCFLKKGHNDGD